MSETTTKQGSGLAIAGLVLGIIAAITSFLPIINNLSAIIAIIGGVFAVISLIGALRGKHDAKGLSIAGVVLAVVSFAVVLATQSAYKAAIDKAAGGSRPVSSSSSSEAPAAQEASDNSAPAEEAAPDKDYSHLAVGETVTLASGLSVTVNSVDTSLTSYDGSPVIGVNVTYANNGSSSESFNTFDWKGEDANGAQRSCTYLMDATNELNSGKLSAGGSVTGNIYFEGGTVRVLYFSNMFNGEAAAGWTL